MPGAEKSKIKRSIFQTSNKSLVWKDKEHYITGNVALNQKTNQQKLYQAMNDDADLETLAKHHRVSNTQYDDDDFEDIEARNQIFSLSEDNQNSRQQSDEDDLIQQETSLDAENGKKSGISAELMTMAEAMKKYYRVETHSHIIPYIVREEAWSSDELDATNSTKYCGSSPDGYSVDLDCKPKNATSTSSTRADSNSAAASAANATTSESSDSATEDAWEQKLTGRIWDFGLSPTTLNETIKFTADKKFKVSNADHTEGDWTLTANANGTKLKLEFVGGNATFKLAAPSRPFIFNTVSVFVNDKASQKYKDAVIQEFKLANSTSNATAVAPTIVANASLLNKTLTSKRWFVGQSTDDLTREFKFNKDNTF